MKKNITLFFLSLLFCSSIAQANFYANYIDNRVDIIINAYGDYGTQSLQARYNIRKIGLRYSYEMGFEDQKAPLTNGLQKTQNGTNALYLDLGLFSWWNFTIGYAFSNATYTAKDSETVLKSNHSTMVGFNFYIPVFKGIFINSDIGIKLSPVHGNIDSDIDGTVPPDSNIPPNDFIRPGDTLGLIGTINGNAAVINMRYTIGIGYRF